MEQKLREFKNRRRRENLMEKPKQLIRGILDKVYTKKEILSEDPNALVSCENSFCNDSSVFKDDENVSLSVASSDTSISIPSPSWLTLLLYILYFLLWMIIYLVAIHFEFGCVYLVLSGIVFIFLNTRTGPKKKDEISAYSVFNPGCEAIDGTLKAEHIERAFNFIQH